MAIYTNICNNIGIIILSRCVMDKAAFLAYLKSKGISEESAAKQMAVAEHLDTMMCCRNKSNGSGCGSRAAKNLIESLRESRQDTGENILAILRYGYFTKNDEIYLEAFQILDGIEAMDNLFSRLGEIAGEKERDRIFSMIGEISPGTPSAEKAAVMRIVIGEAVSNLTAIQIEELFESSFRDLPEEHYLKEKEAFIEQGGVDGYIEFGRKRFIAELERCMQDGKLFFGQEVTPEVVAYVSSDPEIAFGRRDGTSVYITKIPFRTKKWLEEKDPVRKRHLYCHCPWARESLLFPAGPVNKEFCRCSAGFHKKPWEVALGQPLKCEVIESVLAGDDRCRFKLQLP